MRDDHAPNLDKASILSLRVFQAVADSQSFSKAARHLRMSPSVVTNHVLGLERMLRVALFSRTTRKVTITGRGERFYREAKAILGRVDETLQSLAQSAPPSGHLRVQAPPLFAQRTLGPHLGGFLKAHRGITVDLIASSATLDMVAERISVAIVFRNEPPDKNGHLAMGESNLVYCASPEYLKKAGVPAAPDALTDHQCLNTTVAGVPEPWVFRANGRASQIHVNGPMTSDNAEILRLACLDGLGIGRFNVFEVEEDLRRGDLVEVLSQYHPVPNQIYGVTCHRDNICPASQLFMEFVHGLVTESMPATSRPEPRRAAGRR